MDTLTSMTGPQRQPLIKTGNDTFDKFLGGGFLPNSLNVFEREGPSSRLLDAVWNKSIVATSLYNVVVVNFNTQHPVADNTYLMSLPQSRSVKSDLMYKDVRGKSGTAEIKIAWRYSSKSSSPSDSQLRMDQIDFGITISDKPTFKIMNLKSEDEFNIASFIRQLEKEVADLKKLNSNQTIVIFKDLIHPFSPIIDRDQLILKLVYVMRCFSRTLGDGMVLMSYDIGLMENHEQMKQLLYNSADCVVSFFSFETGQNKLTGYKHMDGIVSYVKVPKINTFGFAFQRELSDWGYRFTKNHRFFLIDELNLPPCHDDEDEGKVRKQQASQITNIEHKRFPLKQVGPLEDFRECAKGILTQEL